MTAVGVAFQACGGVNQARMKGLRKIFRALAIVILPVIGAAFIYGSSSGMETAVGLGLIIFAFGLIATWFWQPW